MVYNKSKEQLRYALRNQKTISIPKLNRLLQNLNISLKPSESVEIRYLKNEIRKKNKALSFYADRSKYDDQGSYWEIVIDEGRTARKALKGEIKDESNN